MIFIYIGLSRSCKDRTASPVKQHP